MARASKLLQASGADPGPTGHADETMHKSAAIPLPEDDLGDLIAIRKIELPH
jgi:hypothetical protein